MFGITEFEIVNVQDNGVIGQRLRFVGFCGPLCCARITSKRIRDIYAVVFIFVKVQWREAHGKHQYKRCGNTFYDLL